MGSLRLTHKNLSGTDCNTISQLLEQVAMCSHQIPPTQRKSCRSLPASCFKHLPAPEGNKKMQQQSQGSSGMLGKHPIARCCGRTGQCSTTGDFQFFRSDATKYYLQAELYLYVDTSIYM